MTLEYSHSYAAALSGRAESAAGLVRAADGNFYGIRAQGGPNTCRPVLPISCGAVIKVTSAGDESVFYAFGSIADDGYTPRSLILGRDGALYGTTNNGGKFGGGGTFFRLTLSGSYTSLYSFGGSVSDGVVPNGIIQASDGNFYGTTASGGANHCSMIPQAGSNCGTVYKITPTGAETVLHSFGEGASDGIEPQADLVEGNDGNLYGTTSLGGSNQCASTPHDCGTVFKVSTVGNLTIVHSFGASTADGIAPLGTLLKAGDGALYGFTPSGGGGRCGGFYGCGVVFKLNTAGVLSTIYAFSLQSRSDGDGPNSLIIGQDGNLYGTTVSGGAYQCDSCGTVFKLSLSGALTTLYSFGPVNTNSARPVTLAQGNDQAFYGRTEWGPILSGDPLTIFKLTIK